LITVITIPLLPNSILYNVHPIISYMAFLGVGAWLATSNAAKGEKTHIASS
jgi:hypothetical protein